MARRHFNGYGFPNIPMIVEEMKSYIQSIEIDIHGGYCDILDPASITYFGKTMAREIQFSGNPKRNPFQLREIYVGGSQAAYFPDSYLVGPHDLDLVVGTNVYDYFDLKGSLIALLSIHRILQFRMNDPSLFDTVPPYEKCYAIDIYPGLDSGRQYFQIFPVERRIRTEETIPADSLRLPLAQIL